ncbi:MAG TPA: hypothetical protein VMZ52_14175, partial [Bryobacteraceae bacterium]|nr:hypothetical protein [Bryobacteraceae bacterium]
METPTRALGGPPATGQNPVNALRGALTVGLCVVLAVLFWQFLQVHYLYQDNWTSLFYTGADYPMPEALAHEHIYRFPKVYGYDGQLYHLIAHDPFFTKGFASYIDIPRLRYHRILVSALAALFSFGRDEWVDRAYRMVILGFIFLGTFWLARWCAWRGRSVMWGMMFAITPAAVTSGSLMVIDVALAALTIGAICYDEQEAPTGLFLVLACAALVRETGFLLVFAWCAWLLFQRQFRRAFLYSAAVLPAAGWWLFVQLHTGPGRDAWLSPIPLAGIIRTLSHPFVYDSGWRGSALVTLDRLGLLGMVIALAFTYRDLLRPHTWRFAHFIGFAFAALATFLYSGDVWPEVAAFGRTFTPLLLIVTMSAITSRNWWKLMPLSLVMPRIG